MQLLHFQTFRAESDALRRGTGTAPLLGPHPFERESIPPKCQSRGRQARDAALGPNRIDA